MHLRSLKPIKTALPLCGLVLPLFLGGCQSTESALNGLRENEIVRNAAKGILTGKAYDKAAIALRNQDSEALLVATSELSRFDPAAAIKLNNAYFLVAAEQLVADAADLDTKAQRNENATQKRKLEMQAAQKYREALRISPQFPSKNRDLLNALGYFLADRGNSQSDYQTAEVLTRNSMKSWDNSIKKLPEGIVRDFEKFMRAHAPQDSLAWALFKQKKFDEAAREQKSVLQTVEKIGATRKLPISADLYYHYAEIERARGDNETARTNYQIALQLEPKHKASQDALRTLPPAKPKPIEPAVPEPSPAPQTIPSPQPGLTA